MLAGCRVGPAQRYRANPLAVITAGGLLYLPRFGRPRRHLSATLQEWSKPAACVRGGLCNGVRTMTDLVYDVLLFSSMLALFTGIMIAGREAHHVDG